MPTAKKAEQIAELTDSISRSQLTILCDYRGLSVSALQQLRTNLRPHGAEFHVAKNTLTNIAAKANGVEGLDEYLNGPTGIVFGYGDIVATAKTVGDFVRTSRVMQVKAGVLGTTVVSADEVEAVASLPPREVILAKLVGMLASPMSRTVGVLSGPSRSIAYLVNARAEQLGDGEAAAD